MYMVDRQKYGRAIEDLENDMLKKRKDAFPSNMSDACKLLNGYRNKYGSRRHMSHVNVTWTQVPEDILQRYRDVVVAIDIMAINEIPFMVSISRHIHFGTAELIRNKTKKTLLTSMEQIVRAYHARGFRVTTVLADGGFECIRNGLADMGITLNVASRNEHVPEIERYIRTVKERVQAIAVLLPFAKYPPRLIAEMVYNVVFWLNSFPHNDGVHATISPRTLITGLAID